MNKRINYSDSNVWMRAQRELVARKDSAGVVLASPGKSGVIADKAHFSLESKVRAFIDAVAGVDAPVSPAI